MAQEIKFGTDGWRGIIADDFTFDNVRRVAGAIASYVLKYEEPQRGVFVAYDARFASPRAAGVVAEVVSAAGIAVRLANDYTPTPALSYAVKHQGAAGGAMVTSSHNPWNWNGVKFKGKFGGSATPAIMKKIEEELALGAAPKGNKAAIEKVDFKQPYIAAVCRFADLDLIAKTKFKFAVDAMYGSGRGVLSGIFASRGIEHVAIREELNPLFPGINPEPIEPHTKMLQETVVREHCDAGLAVDGDADRVGAVAEDGSFVDSHKILCVLLRWLLERKKWPGEVTRAFNTTRMADRIAAKYGRKLHETCIGFKYVADLMMEREILIGGEESGGIGYSRFLPERDGVLNCLLLANVMAEEGKPLGRLVADLQHEFGPHYYGRRDLHIPEDVKQNAIQRARDERTQTLGRYRVLKKEHLDGVKFFLDAPVNENGAEAWVLFRASGTEPLLRLYTEASSPGLVAELLVAGESFVTMKDDG
ncbi:Phosphoglucosamine mutase [Candidatus Sulfotelmatobacter kueseliae]|uniref:Phosphoglucosamine mutase n=1 Tax=Candidatus Sulfotelmatobacter kueseliae TaxID=2042962 RepID=A0A2U3L576_9BACT|nr:Phosphoglucosamine mutase [Candidatus Sulfotelmatobacter kueseliae]